MFYKAAKIAIRYLLNFIFDTVKILIVVATAKEVALLKKAVRKVPALEKKTDFLVTGVGMTATAYQLAKKLQENKFDLAVNLGIAGSFRKSLKTGEVLNVAGDCFADLGARGGNQFLTLAEMGLQKRSQYPFRKGRLYNAGASKYSSLRKLKKVNAITVNTVYSGISGMKSVVKKFNPDIETMEGAAFFYVCMMEKLPCVQLRAVSNIAGIRDKKKWNIPLALKNLSGVAIDFLLSTHK